MNELNYLEDNKNKDIYENLKIDVKCTDMSNELIEFCISITLQAIENYNYLIRQKEMKEDNIDQKEISIPNYFSFISENIKIELDKYHSPPWNVIIGENYGSFFTHEENHFLIFKLNSIWVTIFKTA